MKKMFVMLFVFFAFAAVTMAYAEVPNEIRYNGRLKSYQTPVSGTRQMNFKIYDSANSGTALWESGTQNVDVSSGIFSYTMIVDSKVDFRKKDLWLQLVVDGKELTPREKLMTQPYALHSRDAEGLSSNSEMKVQVAASTAVIGVNSSGEIYSKSAAAGNTEFYMVPKGAIIMWSGSKNDIPAGWALCDGNNGTPNLQGRFVLGQGTIRENNVDYTYAAGQTGGEVKHTLTIAEMPSHNHLTSIVNSAAPYGVGDSAAGATGAANLNGNARCTSTQGGGQSHNNMPAYYVLCYIMKK